MGDFFHSLVGERNVGPVSSRLHSRINLTKKKRGIGARGRGGLTIRICYNMMTIQGRMLILRSYYYNFDILINMLGRALLMGI